MIKKLLLSSILWVGLALPCAFAQDYTFTSSDTMNYSPNSVTIVNSFTATSSSVSSYELWSYPYPHITFYDSSENAVCSFYISDGSVYAWEAWQSCEFEAWETYTIWSTDEECFSSVTISDWLSSLGGSWSSDSVFPELSVPSSFTSWLTQLVENFGGTIANWIPSVLLIALWITAIFVLFRVVRWYAKSAFKW